MKVLGITGGVGAGKSTVLSYLSGHWGARVIQADQAGHFLMEPGQECYSRIVEVFGEEILRPDRALTGRSWAGWCFRIRPGWKS